MPPTATKRLRPSPEYGCQMLTSSASPTVCSKIEEIFAKMPIKHVGCRVNGRLAINRVREFCLPCRGYTVRAAYLHQRSQNHFGHSVGVIEIAAAEDIPQRSFLSGRIHSIRTTTTSSTPATAAAAAARALGEESIMKGSPMAAAASAAGDRPRDW